MKTWQKQHEFRVSGEAFKRTGAVDDMFNVYTSSFHSFQKQNLHCLLVGISGKIRYNGRW